MAKIKITISASAVDSALSDEVVPLLSSAVDASNRATILAGSGWRAFSDQACTNQIGLKEVYTSATAFRYDVAAASLSALSDTDIYLEDGNGATADIDPYPATDELSMPLIEDFNDDTSNGNDGTGVGGVTAGGVTGPDGVLPATDFDGTGDRVQLPSVIQAADTTLSMWIDNNESNSNFVLAFGTTVPQRFYIGTFNNRHVAAVGTTFSNFATGAAPSGWYHAALIYDHSLGTSYFYVNGVLNSSGGSALTLAPSNQTIGNVSTDFWDGGIASCNIYSQLRSAASLNLEYILTGPDAATYVTAEALATFNAAWAAQSNVLIGAA